MRKFISTTRARTPDEKPNRSMDSDKSAWTLKYRCSADWEKMPGDDQRRFCAGCQRFVYNVSAMSRAQREALASPGNMHECVFYAQRRDGEVARLSFLAALRRWFPLLRLAGWSALVAVLPVTLTGCMGVRAPRPGEVRPVQPEATPTSSQTTNQ